MKFYRDFKRPQAIGFDLDDTLYDNLPVLLKAEDELHKFMIANFPKTEILTIKDWTSLRAELVAQTPSLTSDFTTARLYALQIGLQVCGYSLEECTKGSQQGLAHFLTWRNKVNITAEVHQLLANLSQQFTLFVISNGNADITQCGLSPYFEFAIRPSQTTPMKPASDLFLQAEEHLGLSGSEILYVGDHPVSDIVGSGRMGWQNVWLNVANTAINHYKKPLMLPTIEINKIEALALLLKPTIED